MMRSALLWLLASTLVLQFSACEKPPCLPETPNQKLYSDYFVFIADDGGSRLVLPMDFNWSPQDEGYEIEFKSWHGTDQAWPINYQKMLIEAEPCMVPQESWDHAANASFSFNESQRQITTNIDGVDPITLTIPPASDWIEAPGATGAITTYAFRTTAMVGSSNRTGWVIYERIRAASGSSFGSADFAAFFWIPLVVNGNLYHFESHKGEELAYRWVNNAGSITVDKLTSIDLTILATSSDATSGRTNIPDQLQIKVPTWNFDIILNSTGFQAGYGAQFPNGLGYYRQSLMEPAANSPTVGYGMLELILEDD